MSAAQQLSSSSCRENIVFIHPDLGIGGAERLVIDAAVGLQERGHRVTIYTSYCDRAHCFDEARDGTYLYTALSCFGNGQTASLTIRACL